jgi:hypothetical protein
LAKLGRFLIQEPILRLQDPMLRSSVTTPVQ